jgi:hypothetical protein
MEAQKLCYPSEILEHFVLQRVFCFAWEKQYILPVSYSTYCINDVTEETLETTLETEHKYIP